MAAAEAVDLPGDEEERGPDPGGRPPFDMRANDPEEEPHREGLEHEGQELPEEDGIDHVAREPVESAEGGRAVPRLEQRLRERVLEERAVGEPPHPELVDHRVGLEGQRAGDDSPFGIERGQERGGDDEGLLEPRRYDEARRERARSARIGRLGPAGRGLGSSQAVPYCAREGELTHDFSQEPRGNSGSRRLGRSRQVRLASLRGRCRREAVDFSNEREIPRLVERRAAGAITKSTSRSLRTLENRSGSRRNCVVATRTFRTSFTMSGRRNGSRPSVRLIRPVND